MVTRRRMLLNTAAIGVLGLLPFRKTRAQEGNSFNSAEQANGNRVVALEDQLNNGLRTTTQAQRRFVQVVVANVNAGRMPRAMVNLVYEWALNRNGRVPFPYFQFALRILARRRGIML